MAKYNQKNMIPRSNQPDKSKKGFLLSRAHHLNKDIITFFGPDQPPDAIAPTNYSPADKWPSSGKLLRVPQIVNLIVILPYVWDIEPELTPGLNYQDLFTYSNRGQTTTDWADFAGSLISDWDGDSRPSSYPLIPGGPSYPVLRMDVQGQVFSDGAIEMVSALFLDTGDPFNDSATWKDDFIVPHSSPGSSGWYGVNQQSVTNPFPAEYNRLLTEFSFAKTMIEKVRVGKTYVNIVIPFGPYGGLALTGSSWSPWSEYGNYTTPLLDSEGNPLHFPWQQNYFNKFPGYYWPYICPSTKFFGTNLLTIYCGCPATTEQIILNNISFFDTTPLGLARTRTFPYMLNNFQYFSKLAIRFYGLQLPITSFSSISGEDASMEDPPSQFAGMKKADPTNISIYFDGPPSVFPNQPWEDLWAGGKQHFVDNLIYNENLQIDALNGLHTTFQQNLNSLLIEDQGVLHDAQIDAQFSGYTSQLDGAGIAELIAKYYNFDLTTGKDPT